MKILVMGAGGVGGWFGAKLAAAGHDVTFVARGAHLAALQAAGVVVVRSGGGEWHAKVEAVEEPADAGSRIDLVILAVKARDHAAAMDLLYPVIEPTGTGATILTLQNGIDLHESLLERFGPAVLWGSARIGSGLGGPGVIEHVARGEVVLGEPSGGTSTRTAAVAKLFEDAGVPATVSESMRRDLWLKLAWNAPFNAVTALAGATVGEVLDRAPLRALVLAAIREALAVARSEGVDLPDELADMMVEYSGGLRDVRTSMLQDRMRGLETEHDALGGSVVRRGAAKGVAAPVLETLTRLMAGTGPR